MLGVISLIRDVPNIISLALFNLGNSKYPKFVELLWGNLMKTSVKEIPPHIILRTDNRKGLK